ncbi:hypothetical protein ABKV19_007367 [Rosa sericea]
MALEFIGGEIFNLLNKSVKRAVKRRVAFKTLLQDMRRTLKSLKTQARVIQQIRQLNLELDLPNDDIGDLEAKVIEGTQLVDMLSAMKFRLWNFCCTNDCARQLTELNDSLEELLQKLKLPLTRDVKEILKWVRKINDDQDEIKGLLKTLILQQNGGNNSMEASTSASGSNTQIEGNGSKAPEGLEAAFGLLFDVVVEVIDKTVMFRLPLWNLKYTLECLKPLVEDIAKGNKVLDRPKQELKNLRRQVDNGVQLVRKCSQDHLCAKLRKEKYTNQLFSLDQFLQKLFHVLILQVAKNLMDTSVSIRNIQKVVKQIQGSVIKGSCQVPETPEPLVPRVGVQTQFGINSSSAEVPEPSWPTVGLDVKELIDGEVFEKLLDGVTRAVDRRVAFKDLLQHMKRTLASLRGQAQFIQKTPEVKESSQSRNDIADLEIQMIEGANLVNRLSTCRVYNYCCLNGSDHQLHELNRSLERLLENLQFQLARDVYDILKQARQNYEEQDLKQLVESRENHDDHDMRETEVSLMDGEEALRVIEGSGEVTEADGPPCRRVELDALNTQGTSYEIWKTDEANSQIEMSSFRMKVGVEQNETSTVNLETFISQVNKSCISTDSTEEGIKQIEASSVIQNEAKIEDGCAVPELPQLTVGFDEPAEELKMKPFKDGLMSVLVITAPGKCGKITLAAKFCEDEEIKDKFKNNVKWFTKQEFQPSKACLVSLSSDKLCSAETKRHNLRVPEVDVLLLNFGTEKYALSEFVRQFENATTATLCDGS